MRSWAKVFFNKHFGAAALDFQATAVLKKIVGFPFWRSSICWMQEKDDMGLLREYAIQGSETAFETLVHRHTNMVYSTGLRQVRDSHLAEEITQALFVVLARKAKTLHPKTILLGWLFKTARFVAITELRNAIRRKRCEQEASEPRDTAEGADQENGLPGLRWEHDLLEHSGDAAHIPLLFPSRRSGGQNQLARLPPLAHVWVY